MIRILPRLNTHSDGLKKIKGRISFGYYLDLINPAGGLYGTISTEVVSTD